MAQELHDVVAHSLSVIAVQAGIGAHLIEREPAEAARALDAIRTASNDAEGEVARLIDVLRGSNAESAELTPVPALTDVAAALRPGRRRRRADRPRHGGRPRCRAGGGLAGGLPDRAGGVDQRGPPRRARRRHRRGPGLDGPGRDRRRRRRCRLARRSETHGAARVGHGLAGMAERAQMYGGDAEAGPRPGGGFAVRATLRPRLPTPVGADHSGCRRIAAGRPVVCRRYRPDTRRRGQTPCGVGRRARDRLRRVGRLELLDGRGTRGRSRGCCVHANGRMGLDLQDRLLRAADRPAPIPGDHAVRSGGARRRIDGRRLQHRHRLSPRS